MKSRWQSWVSGGLPRPDSTPGLFIPSGEEPSSRPRALGSRSLCLLLLLLTLSVIACHQSKQKVIAVVPKGQGHIFWQTVHAGANAAGKKFGVKVLWNGPASEIEISKQINILEDFINRRVD